METILVHPLVLFEYTEAQINDFPQVLTERNLDSRFPFYRVLQSLFALVTVWRQEATGLCPSKRMIRTFV